MKEVENKPRWTAKPRASTPIEAQNLAHGYFMDIIFLKKSQFCEDKTHSVFAGKNRPAPDRYGWNPA